jgi:hypothetical protein
MGDGWAADKGNVRAVTNGNKKWARHSSEQDLCRRQKLRGAWYGGKRQVLNDGKLGGQGEE